MLQLCLSFLLIFFCLIRETGAEQQTVTASWLLKSAPTATRDAETDKGSIQVPLQANDGCRKNYLIERLFWSLDAMNEQRIRQAFLGLGSSSDLEVTITKLFAGRDELPTLVIYDNNGKSYRLTFDSYVDLNKWNEKEYQINAKFPADSIRLPKFWNKVELMCDSPDYLKVGDNKPDNNIVGNTPAEQGMKLHLRILKQHPQIEQSYEKPFLWGELTDNPLVVITVPTNDWDFISVKEKELLCEYAASLVTQARSNPFHYTKTPQNAPIAPILKQNVSKMTDKSWGILVGRISENGKHIYADKLAKTGK